MDNMDILMNDYTREFGSGSATVECNIEVTAKGGVSKLLSVSANVKSATVDKNGDTAKVRHLLPILIYFREFQIMTKHLDFFLQGDKFLFF